MLRVNKLLKQRDVGLYGTETRHKRPKRASKYLGVECGRGQNDTLRKLLLGVPVEPIGFFTSKPLFLLSQKLS